MTAVQTIEHEEPALPVAATPMAMIDRALAQGASVEVIEKLMNLQERWSAGQARRAFDEAMAAAKAEIPVIGKNRTVDFTSSKGRTHYRHESLDEIARVVTPILAKHGLSYRFRTTSIPNEPVTVTRIISHRDGHSEENTLCAGKDESGNKNSIQAVGSTITYLQRYTLKAALGLAAAEDDDGRASSTDASPISDEQLATIRSLIDETGSDTAKFCAYFKIDALPDLPAAKFDSAVKSLNAKRGRS